MVNPDGVNLVQNGINSVQNPNAVSKIKINNVDSQGYSSWKANINGIDLNRNYPDIWYVNSSVQVPASSNFKGYTPLSEPETKAIANFLNTNMCWANISFHTQGEGVYGWNDANIRFYPQLSAMVSHIIKDSGLKKMSDTTETKYGNFANYARKTYLKPTLTVELCQAVGPYPYPAVYFSKVWTPAENICLIVAEEVMKMQDQDYRVYQNDRFLQAFCDKQYALAFARKWTNAKVLFVKDVKETITTISPITIGIVVNDKSTTMQAYRLDDSSYIKLRDLAVTLSSTEKQFEVGYNNINNAIMLTSGSVYTVVGGELAANGSMMSESVRDSTIAIYLNDSNINLQAYNIGGSNYFELQALTTALNLGVTFDSTSRVISFNRALLPAEILQ
ncbi:MAG: M14 family zinc carboxypeptidase [Clostridia bacterium]